MLFTASNLASITSPIHSWALFLLWFHTFILSGVISPLLSSSMLGTYRPGEFIFQCPMFLPFCTVHGVLKARILKWFAIPFSSGPHSVRILVELFQILKDDAMKVLHSICQQIWKTQQWPQGWKKSVFILIPKKHNTKECPNYRTIALISHASKGMLKILQARLQQYMNCELPDVQAGFRKGRRTRDQIANIRWIMEKAREFQKNIYFCFIDYANTLTLTVWITINCGKF